MKKPAQQKKTLSGDGGSRSRADWVRGCTVHAVGLKHHLGGTSVVKRVGEKNDRSDTGAHTRKSGDEKKETS